MYRTVVDYMTYVILFGTSERVDILRDPCITDARCFVLQ